MRPAYSPAAPAFGCNENESNPVIEHNKSPKSSNISYTIKQFDVWQNNMMFVPTDPFGPLFSHQNKNVKANLPDTPETAQLEQKGEGLWKQATLRASFLLLRLASLCKTPMESYCGKAKGPLIAVSGGTSAIHALYGNWCKAEHISHGIKLPIVLVTSV